MRGLRVRASGFPRAAPAIAGIFAVAAGLVALALFAPYRAEAMSIFLMMMAMLALARPVAIATTYVFFLVSRRPALSVRKNLLTFGPSWLYSVDMRDIDRIEIRGLNQPKESMFIVSRDGSNKRFLVSNQFEGGAVAVLGLLGIELHDPCVAILDLHEPS